MRVCSMLNFRYIFEYACAFSLNYIFVMEGIDLIYGSTILRCYSYMEYKKCYIEIRFYSIKNTSEI